MGGRNRSRYTLPIPHRHSDPSPTDIDLPQYLAQAILEARHIARREAHLNCRAERVNQFVVSLRRILRSKGDRGAIKTFCNTRLWLDAGLPTPPVSWIHESLKPYHAMLGVAMKLADARDATIDSSFQELQLLIRLQESTVNEMQKINDEAEKVLEGIEKLASNL